MRPFSRPQPSNRPGEERSPRPARPRLNRETVDRAWESGAPTQHADYRTRSNNGQPPRNSWRNNQQSEHSPAQNGRKPFGNRPDGNRRFDRTSNEGYQDNRSRSFGTDRHQNQFGERRNNDVRGNTGGPNRYGARPGYGDTNTNNRPYGQRPPFREHEQGRGYPQRDAGGDNRAPRSFDRDSRPAPGNERPFRSFDRDSRPTPGGERPFVVLTAIAVPHRVANGPSAVLTAIAVPRVVSTVAADLRAALNAAIVHLIMHRSEIHRIHVGRVVQRRNTSTPSVSSLPRMHLRSISRVTTSVSIRRSSRNIGDLPRQGVLSKGKRPLINLLHGLRERNSTLRACLMDVS